MDNKKIKDWIIQHPQIKWWLVLMGVSVVFTYSSYYQTTSNEGIKGQKDYLSKNVDTLIPEGFVLLPVELSNRDSLDGFLSEKGVVDLYVSNSSSMKTIKVAGGVKIIRSPQNPDQLAVLVSEKKARFLIKRSEAFYAIIQNPEKRGEGVYPLGTAKPKRQIIIEHSLDSTPMSESL